MPRNKLFIAGLSIAVMCGVLTQPAGATSMLSLSDGVTTVTASDSGTGMATYNGSVGNFSYNVTTGLTYPILGTLSAPQLDLNSVNVSSNGGGGTLTIMYSANNFATFDAGLAGLITQIGGTTQGSVDLKFYTDAGNALFATTTLLTSLGSYAGAFSGSDQTNFQPTGPYSLTLVATVTHGSVGSKVSSFDASVAPVPEPATSLLLGVGLVGAGLWRKFQQTSA